MRLNSTAILTGMLFFLAMTLAQAQKIILKNAVKYDEYKYDGYRGKPYLYDGWRDVKVYSKGGTEFKNIQGNYDMRDRNFVVKYDDRYVLLPEALYPKIIFENEDGEEQILAARLHPKMDSGYAIVHYQSENITVCETFKTREQISTIHKPGENMDKKQVIVKSKYHIIRDGQLEPFGYKQKHLVETFGHEKEIKDYRKANRLKLKSMADAVAVIQYLEESDLL